MRFVHIWLLFLLGAALPTQTLAQVQASALELRVLNFKWDAENELMAGLDQPYRDQAVRQDRAQHLGPRLWKGFVDEKIVASKPRSYVVFFWNVNNVPVEAMSAYRVNGDKSKEFKHSVSKSTFEVVKDGSYPTFDPLYRLDKPAMVIRIRADGTDPVGASLQFPWSMVGPDTHILVCTEDKLTVYPNKVTASDGLWFTPQMLMWLRDTKKSTRVLTAFVSKDG